MIGLYCRVSTDEQNIAQQRQLLVKHCCEKGLQYRTYADMGVSGSISDRPQWNQLIKDCEAGKIDTIMVVKVDRITRELKYAVQFHEWITTRKIELVSLYDSIKLEEPDGYFTFMLLCLLSERELIINRWRSRIGIERAKKEGKYKGRKPGAKNRGSPKQ